MSPEDPERPQIFVSYAREDSAFALRLVQDLRDRGARVWITQSPIRPSLDEELARQGALIDAGTYIVVLSPSAVASEMVLSELSFAVENGKGIFPVLYQACTIPKELDPWRPIGFEISYESEYEKRLGILWLGMKLTYGFRRRE